MNTVPRFRKNPSTVEWVLKHVRFAATSRCCKLCGPVFEAFRKEGMVALQGNQAGGGYVGWMECPSCESGLDAGKRR